MKEEYQALILEACSAQSLKIGEKVQTLWSGYGQIVRVYLETCDRPSVIVKHVVFPKTSKQVSEISHMRKVTSYQVEISFYQNYRTDERCRIPECLAARSFGEEMLLVLEDLDAAGFPERRTAFREADVKACLQWLAQFHARFLGVPPKGLWPVGTYWHLDTRPEELQALRDEQLKSSAAEIDSALNSCRFKTILHGDAKLENFCFSADGRVAAVDFQYCGAGCGIKDVVYFLTSVLDERQCERKVPGFLDFYFSELKGAVNPELSFSELEDEWRSLFSFAWTDFYRFLLGWSPGHYKINRYGRRLIQEVLRKLKQDSERVK
ncbi:uncharacterized protein pkdc [Hoplias malabaricus]|uniref:uncharacterized protein pkdc n=1 Tax=Hoplias malabaricus TaxID=27720 RepID=UPI00346289E0